MVPTHATHHNTVNIISSEVQCFMKILNFAEAVAQRYSIKKDVLRNFAKFTGKHLCQSLFSN